MVNRGTKPHTLNDCSRCFALCISPLSPCSWVIVISSHQVGRYVLTQLERVENSPRIYVLFHMPSCFPNMSSLVLSSQPLSHTSNSRLFVLIIVFLVALDVIHYPFPSLPPYALSCCFPKVCFRRPCFHNVSHHSLSVRPAAHKHLTTPSSYSPESDLSMSPTFTRCSARLHAHTYAYA